MVVAGSGTFTMEGGEISGNESAMSGGGVGVAGSGTFTMEGGEISGNTAQGAGGGVLVLESGTFTMSGYARIHTNNTVCLIYDSPDRYNSVTIGGVFSGPAGPVAKLDLYSLSDPASNWSGKAVLKPAKGLSLLTINDRFILGGFIHNESPSTFSDEPITGYEIGADGTLQVRGQ